MDKSRTKNPAEIVAVASQKGGVAKTTTAVNLASCLADYGKRVLLIDLDPQGHCGRATGFDPELLKRTSYDLFFDATEPKKLVRRTQYKNFDLVVSNYKLASLELDMMAKKMMPDYGDLRKTVLPLSEGYDFVLLDCPPSISYLTINALAASTSVLIPVQCEYFALEAVPRVISAIANIQRTMNPSLDILGILLTMYDPRSRLSTEILTEANDLFKGKVFGTPIPRTISLSECQLKGVPINHLRPNSRGTMAYKVLARDVIEYQKQKQLKQKDSE